MSIALTSGFDTLMANGKTAASPKEKVDMLNEHFVLAFTRDKSAGAPPDLGPSTFQAKSNIDISDKCVPDLL